MIDGWHADDADDTDSFFTFLTTESHGVPQSFIFHPQGQSRGTVISQTLPRAGGVPVGGGGAKISS